MKKAVPRAIGHHMVMEAIKFILVPTQSETLTAMGAPLYWKPFTSISMLSCSLSSNSPYSSWLGVWTRIYWVCFNPSGMERT